MGCHEGVILQQCIDENKILNLISGHLEEVITLQPCVKKKYILQFSNLINGHHTAAMP